MGDVFYKNGDEVIIIYKEGSFLNSYKGYIGVIKHILRNGEAMIYLPAQPQCNLIHFTKNHFIKRILD